MMPKISIGTRVQFKEGVTPAYALGGSIAKFPFPGIVHEIDAEGKVQIRLDNNTPFEVLLWAGANSVDDLEVIGDSPEYREYREYEKRMRGVED